MTDLYENVLYDFQKKVVDDSFRNKKYALFLEPGLGKTFVSLSIIQKRNKRKIIIVCQSSKILDWEEDIKEHLGYRVIKFQKGPKKDKENFMKYKDEDGVAFLKSFQTYWRRDFILKYMDHEWAAIEDESQYLKSRVSAVGKFGVKVSKKIEDVLLLSGTPINKYEDYYNQLLMLGLDMKYKDFEEKFCITKQIKLPTSRFPFTVISGYKDIDLLLRAIRTQAVFVKTEDALDLPPKIWTDIHLEHDKPKIYNKVKKLMIYKDIEMPHAGVLHGYLRELTSGFIKEYTNISMHKQNALKELLEVNKNNFVIFYNFVQESKDIRAVCEAMDIDVYEFNGQVKNGYEARDNREGNDKQFIIMCQYQSAAEGMNLQFVNHQIYYSPPEAFIKYKQSWARINRIGQKEDKTFYYRFITNRSVEVKTYKKLEQGKDYDSRSFANDLANGDVEDM